MRKIAAHCIFCNSPFSLHYVLLDGGRLVGVLPLDRESAGVEFFDGIVAVLPQGIPLEKELFDEVIREFETDDPFFALEVATMEPVAVGDPVDVYQISGVSLSPPEFRTRDGRCECDIKRL